LPSFTLEFYLDRLGRPTYATSADGVRTLVRSGQDLDAQGLTEYMWDVVYWSWINVVLVVLLGDRAWWLYLVVPAYSVYAVATTVGGLKGMLSGLGGAGSEGDGAMSQSSRQKKMEKRGGQRVAYR